MFIRREIPNYDGVYVKGFIESVDVVFTVDTGASISILSKQIYDEIPDAERPKLSKSTPILKNADGNSIPCHGTASFNIRFGSLYLEKKLVIAEITDDILFGADILLGDRDGPADLLFSQHKIVFKGADIEIEVDGYPKKVRKICLADNYKFEPLSETIVDVFVERFDEDLGGNFILEPNISFAEKYSLVMAPSLVDITNHVTQKVRIMNPFNVPQIIVQNTVIGSAEPIDEFVVIADEEDVSETGNNVSVRRIKLSSEQTTSQFVTRNTKCSDVNIELNDEAKPLHESYNIPDHLKVLFDTTGQGLSPEQLKILETFLSDNQDVFSKSDTDIGRTHLTEHVIETGDALPIKLAPRRVPLAFINEADEAMQKFFDSGTARPSTSPWASPLVFVRKKNGQVRPCVDYRKLNNLTRKDAFPLPRTQDCFDTVAGATLFSSMDITSAYNQIPVREQDIPKTAVVTKYGLYEFTTMPFGLCNAPATFQRCMELALAGLQWKTCLVYLDDVLVFAQNFDEMVTRLSEVLDRIRLANLKLKPAKCHFFQEEVCYLGHILSGSGVRPNPENIEKIQNWTQPKTVKEVQSFLGLCNYYRRFLPQYSSHIKPLVDLVRKDVKFEWSDECEEAFQHIKEMLLSPAVMAHPMSEGLFILDTDASDFAIGAVLSQIQNGEERVIAFGSKTLSKTEKNYCVTDKELLAIRYFTEYYRVYLLGKPFLIRTDHQALKWLLSMKEPKSRVARWIEALSEFSFTIEHRSGLKHTNADALSRCPNPWNCECKIFEQLRCGPCRKCLRKTEMMLGTLPNETMSDDCVRKVSTSNVTNHYLEKFRLFFVRFALVVVMFLAGLFSPFTLVLTTVLTTVSLNFGLRESSTYQSYQHKVSKLIMWINHLADVKNDGRTRPKNISEFGRGLFERCDITRSDLRSSWPIKTSFFDIKTHQQEDKDISQILDWKNKGDRPYGPEVQASSPATRHYWLAWDSLVIQDGILHRWYYKKNGQSFLQIVIPKSLKGEVLYHMHNTVLSGHLGVKKTREKLLQRFYWFNVREDIYQHIMKCHECTSIKGPPKSPKAPLGSMPSGSPLDRISMDVLGPLPRSNRDNKYILVITDYFTKWVEIYPMPDQTASTCAEKVIDFISRYGCSYDLHSDQGSNFLSKIFKELCQLFEIRKTRTSPYNPRGNGQVERFNRTLISMVKAFLKGEDKDWDKYLCCLAGAYRATVHESTGFTPNMLMFGREVRFPIQIMFGQPEPDQYLSYGDYVDVLKDHLEKAHDLARDNLGSKAKRQKDSYDGKCVFHTHLPGDLVWYACSHSQLTTAPKLRLPYIGPVVVTKKINDLNYEIQLSSDKSNRKIVHHNKIFPYLGTNIPTWIKKLKKSFL